MSRITLATATLVAAITLVSSPVRADGTTAAKPAPSAAEVVETMDPALERALTADDRRALDAVRTARAEYMRQNERLAKLRRAAAERKDDARAARLEQLSARIELAHAQRVERIHKHMSAHARRYESARAKIEAKRDRMKSSAQEHRADAKERTHDRRDSLKDRMNHRRDGVKERIHDRRDGAKEKAGERRDDMKERVSNRRDGMKERIHDRRDAAKEKAGERRDGAAKRLSNRPDGANDRASDRRRNVKRNKKKAAGSSAAKKD